MKTGTIVFQGTSKKGRAIIIRYLTKDDIHILHRYINNLSQEWTFITVQGEKITLKEEKKYIDASIKRIKERTGVSLLIFADGHFSGMGGIIMKEKVEKHVGIFHFSIVKEYRNGGLGYLLMETIIKEAQAHIPQLRIITLDVFANNLIAQTMYKKFGFMQWGILPGGVTHRGVSVDCISMYKKV